eukprot:4914834-Amphidinium_carterae.3
MESENDIYNFKKLDFTKLLDYMRQFLQLLVYYFHLEDYVTIGEEDQYKGHYSSYNDTNES